MAIISTRSRYGLRLLADLAEHEGQGPVDLHSVAERQAIPEKYLAKLVVPLRGAGIVRSVRGARGGFILAKPSGDIDLFTVVEALEGPASLLACTASTDRCPRAAACGTRPLWRGLEKAVHDYLAALSVADAAAPKAPEYFI